MGITKTEGFKEHVNVMADILKVLGHPARLTIIKHIAKTESCISGDLEGIIPLAQPTISRHLSELKRVNLIKGNISGKNVCYCINTEIWQTIEELVFNVSKTIKKNTHC